MSKYQLIYFVVFIAVIGGGGIIYYFSQPLSPEGAHVIELRKEGFYPREITIKSGDRIIFINKRSENFWPASDPHPIHDYLKGFDPKQPLLVGERWSYTFNEPGTWPYHDHLNVSFKGEIRVINAKAAVSGSATDLYCETNDGDGKCFDKLIRDAVKKEGIEAAWQLFTKNFEIGKLPRACHWTAHQIGEEAYELFREGKEFPISYATSYCGYGFFHGFMEGLLRERPDTDYALSFCKRVEEKLGKQGLWNCYHGIGHGFTEDPPDPQTWGNFEAMIKPGIKMCEFLFGESFSDLNLCLTGVFTVPAGFAEKGEYGLSFSVEDPFVYCHSQPYRYHKACYGEFTPKLSSFSDWKLSRLPKILEQIKDDKTTRLVVWVVPSTMMARDIMKDDFSSYINGCRENFSGRLKDICLGGTILGFFTHGEPEKQYLKAFQFCTSRAFLENEREFCYREVFHRLRQEYKIEKVKEACQLVPAAYQKYCPEDVGYKPAYDDPSFE